MHLQITISLLIFMIGSINCDYPLGKDEWQGYILSLHYPISASMVSIHNVMKSYKLKQTPKALVPLSPHHGFKLHGIWPQSFARNAGEQNPPLFDPPKNAVDRHKECVEVVNAESAKHQKLIKKMTKHWPNRVPKNSHTDMWCHEYAKHGFDLFEHEIKHKVLNKIPSTLSKKVWTYFEICMKLFEKYPVKRILSKAKRLGKDNFVTVKNFRDALRGEKPKDDKHFGSVSLKFTSVVPADTSLRPQIHYMKALYIYLDKNGEIVDVPLDGQELGQSGEIQLAEESDYKNLQISMAQYQTALRPNQGSRGRGSPRRAGN